MRAWPTRRGAGTRTGTGASPATRRSHGVASVRAPGLALHARRDGNGVVCERKRGQAIGKRRQILMALKALKLEVSWSSVSTGYLCVKDGRNSPVKVDDDLFQGKHVEPHDNYVLVKNFFEVNNKVPDVSRYCIGVEGCCAHYDDRHRICEDRYLIPHRDVSRQDLAQLLQRQQRQIRNIVLLLESPHECEYINGDIAHPKAPASGPTGNNIDRCLGAVLSRIDAELIKPGCQVIISNPIQFQTSLHAIHRQSLRKDNNKWARLRDNVWRTLWSEQHIQNCFLARLKSYYPKVVINACTGDMSCRHNKPKKIVKNFVRQHLRNVPFYNVPHPSDKSWNNCNCNDIDLRCIPLADPNTDNQ